MGRALLQEAGGTAEPTGIAAWNPRTHGYTAAISFGMVMPLAALISRGFRVRCGAEFQLLMPCTPAMYHAQSQHWPKCECESIPATLSSHPQ